jgi:hypothetical protein
VFDCSPASTRARSVSTSRSPGTPIACSSVTQPVGFAPPSCTATSPACVVIVPMCPSPVCATSDSTSGTWATSSPPGSAAPVSRTSSSTRCGSAVGTAPPSDNGPDTPSASSSSGPANVTASHGSTLTSPAPGYQRCVGSQAASRSPTLGSGVAECTETSTMTHLS